MKKIVSLLLLTLSLAFYSPTNFPYGLGVSSIISPDIVGGSGELLINATNINVANGLIVEGITTLNFVNINGGVVSLNSLSVGGTTTLKGTTVINAQTSVNALFVGGIATLNNIVITNTGADSIKTPGGVQSAGDIIKYKVGTTSIRHKLGTNTGAGEYYLYNNSDVQQVLLSGNRPNFFLQRVLVENTTEATTTLDGSLQTDGGLSVVKNAVIGGKIIAKGILEVSASADNLAIGNVSIIVITASSPITITGFSGGVDGQIIKIITTGGNALTLANESESSSPANRIRTNSYSDITYSASAGTSYIYYSARWREMR